MPSDETTESDSPNKSKRMSSPTSKSKSHSRSMDRNNYTNPSRDSSPSSQEKQRQDSNTKEETPLKEKSSENNNSKPIKYRQSPSESNHDTSKSKSRSRSHHRHKSSRSRSRHHRKSKKSKHRSDKNSSKHKSKRDSHRSRNLVSEKSSKSSTYARALEGAGQPTYNIFVKNLPKRCEKEDLIKLFEGCGRIFSCAVKKKSTPSTKCFGFVNFCSRDAQKKAIKLSGKISLFDSIIECEASSTTTVVYIGNLPPNVEKATVRFHVRKFGGPYRALHFRNGHAFVVYESFYHAEQAMQKLRPTSIDGVRIWVAIASETKAKQFMGKPKKSEAEEQPNERSLFIGNLALTVEDYDLKRRFGKYGHIVGIRIPRVNKTGKSKGFAFIEFDNSGDAEMAIRGEQGERMHGSQMDIDWCRDSPHSSKHEPNVPLYQPSSFEKFNSLPYIDAKTLASLPLMEMPGKPGHFVRAIPESFVQSLINFHNNLSPSKHHLKKHKSKHSSHNNNDNHSHSHSHHHHRRHSSDKKKHKKSRRKSHSLSKPRSESRSRSRSRHRRHHSRSNSSESKANSNKSNSRSKSLSKSRSRTKTKSKSQSKSKSRSRSRSHRKRKSSKRKESSKSSHKKSKHGKKHSRKKHDEKKSSKQKVEQENGEEDAHVKDKDDASDAPEKSESVVKVENDRSDKEDTVTDTATEDVVKKE